VLAAAGRPAGRDDEQVGPGVHQAPEQFGEAQVIAGGEAEGEAGRRIGAGQRDRHEFVAGAHHHRLALVEAEAVDLPVGGGQFAGGGKDEGGVVEGAVRCFLDDGARVQPDPGVARGFRHHLVRGPGGRLGPVGERLVGEGSDGPQFGENHQISAVLFPYEGSGTPPARIDRFVRVYCDLDE
jgi:hypothetical protein